MKNISNDLLSHLQGELSNLAYLVKITRQDGVIKGFTTFDQDLVINNITFKAFGAFTPSAIESTSGLATDNLDITGMISSDDIDDDDIQAGLYNNAQVDFYACNWSDTRQGLIPLRRGWIGEITFAGLHYVAELRGLRDLLQRPVGNYYTAECRFNFCDTRCGLALANFTNSGAVSSVIDRATFSVASLTNPSGAFNYGKIVWSSGLSNGLSMEIKNWDLPSRRITLWLPMAYNIAVGDSFTLYQGCDKRLSTCQRFNNVINFGGFPTIPGINNILQYPDSQ